MKTFFLIILLITTQNIFASSGILSERNLDGIYEMNIQIGHQRFTDIFVLKGKNSAITLTSFGGEIEGSITVPNVFSSALSGHAHCTLWGSFCELAFDIVAHENGQIFDVHYKAQVIREDYLKMINGNLAYTIKGTAYLDNDQVLGDFIAVLRK